MTPELAPTKPRPEKGSSLPDYVRALESAGQAVVYTPLEEVADQRMAHEDRSTSVAYLLPTTHYLLPTHWR